MKKIISVLSLALLLVCLASCNKDKHTHTYDNGVVTTDSLCGGNKTVKYSCTGCTHTYSKTYAVEHDWTKATCTEPKTCSICKETDGDPLGHSYENNTCKRCSATVSIDLTLPVITDTAPLGINNYLNGALTSKLNITAISSEYSASSDSNVTLTVTLAGKKASDSISTESSTACTLVYKLYSENGNVVCSGTFTTPLLKVGDTFADKSFTVSGLENGGKYTLILTDYYTAN